MNKNIFLKNNNKYKSFDKYFNNTSIIVLSCYGTRLLRGHMPIACRKLKIPSDLIFLLLSKELFT